MNCAVIVAHVKSITNVLYFERKLIVVRATTLKKLTMYLECQNSMR